MKRYRIRLVRNPNPVGEYTGFGPEDEDTARALGFTFLGNGDIVAYLDILPYDESSNYLLRAVNPEADWYETMTVGSHEVISIEEFPK